MRARDYPRAVQVLTKLQRQPEFPERPETQELLGLARERFGEVAQAKAEYEEYLRQYPKGPAADRIRTRLRILRAASAAGHTGGLDTGYGADHGWKVSGGASQLYRRDSYGTDLNGPLFSNIVQNAIFTDADLFVHKDGERFTTAFRTSFGYEKTFLPKDGRGVSDRVRITTAFLDLTTSCSGCAAVWGRQDNRRGRNLRDFRRRDGGLSLRPVVVRTRCRGHADRQFGGRNRNGSALRDLVCPFRTGALALGHGCLRDSTEQRRHSGSASRRRGGAIRTSERIGSQLR